MRTKTTDNQPLQLQVNFRCIMQLAEMETRPEGFHCQNCSKTVVDFRSMSDDEIAAAHRSAPGKVCGVYRRSQVYRPEPIPSPRFGRVSLWKPISVAMITVLTASTALQAQQATYYKGRCHVSESPAFKQEEPVAETTTANIITAQVIDGDNGEPLPFVNVFIQERGIGVATDFDGKFSLELPEDVGPDEVLSIRYVGYANQDIRIADLPDLLPLLTAEALIMGDIAIVVDYRDKETPSQVKGWRRIKNFFRSGH